MLEPKPLNDSFLCKAKHGGSNNVCININTKCNVKFKDQFYKLSLKPCSRKHRIYASFTHYDYLLWDCDSKRYCKKLTKNRKTDKQQPVWLVLYDALTIDATVLELFSASCTCRHIVGFSSHFYEQYLLYPNYI